MAFDHRSPARRLASPALAIVLAAGAASSLSAQDVRDPHSFARPDDVAVTHVDLDLTVDFAAHRLQGRADLTIDRRNPGAEELVLDSRDLEIRKVLLNGTEEVPFRLSEPIAILGQALTIPLSGEVRTVRVEYRTSPTADAVQWLDPAQTAGGKLPFLFTQSEAILARTWVPCQDSPGIRITYSATIRTAPDLMAVMSAEGNPRAKAKDGVYRFEQKHPIPSYLLALAVGDLDFRPLGKRAGVYAEPSVVEAAAWELADTEKMIVAAERLYGPYRWGRYDLLVLPPSFPFGGMENPMLTFATPTILAGDRSLVSLVAHELAHSWSGNLVTNATWNDFWLNEGFTSYFENRIMEAVYGRDYADMLLELANDGLKEAVERMGATSRRTWLYADLTGQDPDDGVGAIAYDKGALFLHTLEHAAGRETWDRFLRRYFDTFAFQPMTSQKFVSYLEETLLAEHPEVAAKVDVRAWVFGPGIPAGASMVRSARFEKVDAEVAKFAGGASAQDLATSEWSTHEWLRFLDKLPHDLGRDRLLDLDTVFGLTRSGNSEILDAWFVTTIRADYAPAYPAIEKFLLRVGRRKFLMPVYGALARSEEGKKRALEIYRKARPGYHSVSRGSLDRLLGWKEEAPKG